MHTHLRESQDRYICDAGGTTTRRRFPTPVASAGGRHLSSSQGTVCGQWKKALEISIMQWLRSEPSGIRMTVAHSHDPEGAGKGAARRSADWRPSMKKLAGLARISAMRERMTNVGSAQSSKRTSGKAIRPAKLLARRAQDRAAMAAHAAAEARWLSASAQWSSSSLASAFRRQTRPVSPVIAPVLGRRGLVAKNGSRFGPFEFV